MSNFLTHFGMTKSQRSGFFIFLGLIIVLLGAQWYVTNIYEPSQVSLTEEDYKKIAELKKELNTGSYSTITNDSISPFNPNELSLEDFIALGFSPKQAQTILNYRTSLNGFKTKEQFHKSYGVSDKKFEELKEYILLPNQVKKGNYDAPYKNKKFQKQTASKNTWKPKPFNVNKTKLSDWVETGLSIRQAEGVLNYRKSLGGTFKNKEELKKAYTLPDYVYNRIEPYLVFKSEKKPQINNTTEILSNSEVKTVSINTITKSQLIEMKFPENIAKSIIDCRDYNGRYKNMEDIEKCPDLEGFNSNKIYDINIIFE